MLIFDIYDAVNETSDRKHGQNGELTCSRVSSWTQTSDSVIIQLPGLNILLVVISESTGHRLTACTVALITAVLVRRSGTIESIGGIQQMLIQVQLILFAVIHMLLHLTLKRNRLNNDIA